MSRQQHRRIDVLEIGNSNAVAVGLVRTWRATQIDRRNTSGRAQDKRVRTRPCIDRRLGAAVGNRVVARAGIDDIGAATAIDGVAAGAGRYHVGG